MRMNANASFLQCCEWTPLHHVGLGEFQPCQGRGCGLYCAVPGATSVSEWLCRWQLFCKASTWTKISFRKSRNLNSTLELWADQEAARNKPNRKRIAAFFNGFICWFVHDCSVDLSIKILPVEIPKRSNTVHCGQCQPG